MKNLSTIPRMQRLFAAVLLLVMGFTFSESAAQCVTPPSGLVSWWPGENNANDIQSSNHGSLQNGATFVAGKVGQAFSLDGVNDYIEVPDSPSLTPPSSSITLEAWVKPDAVNGDYVIMSKYNSNNPGVNGVSWYLGLDTIIGPGHLRFAIYQNPAVSIARAIDTNNRVLSVGVWQHVAATFDLATQEMKIYVNGVEVSSTLDPTSSTLTSIADTHTPVRIGVAVNVSGSFVNFWDGLIDEAGIYNRALSASEIQSIYNAGSAGKCQPPPPSCVNPPSGLVSWWPGENNANDIQSSNHGTLQNGAAFAVGKVGQAFSFDGVNDYVSIPHNASLQPIQITVSVWIKANPVQSYTRYLVVDKSHGWVDATGWVLQGESSTGRIAFSYGNGVDFPEFYSTTNVLDNNWHFVTGTLDGSNLKMYVDGILEGSLPYSGTPAGNTRNVNIGASWGGGTFNRFFNGLIDEVDIYNRALSVQEIVAIYNASSAGKCQPPPPSCVNPPSGLVSWWPGENNANDIQSSNHGTVQNGATFTAGKVGQAFSFDGVDDYVSVPDNTDWDFGMNDFTIDLWIKFDQIKRSMFIHQQAGSNAGGFEFDFQPSGLVFSRNGIDGGLARSWSPQVNIWYHLAVTRTSGTYKLYVNGSQLGSEQADPLPIADVTGIVRIGSWSDGNYEVDGLIDELDIYNRALSADEIADIYNAGSAGKCTNTPPPTCVNPPSDLVSWWPGDDNANDIQGSNHGTLQNGATFASGKVGQAFSFDGVDDYVEVPDNPSLTPPSSSITLEAWVKPDAVNGNYVIISKYNSNNPSVNGVSWYLGLDTIIGPGHLRFAIYQNPAVSIGRAIDTNNPVLSVGVWQHVAATFDLATQEMKIYVNGVEVPSTLEPGSATLISIADSHTPVRIGVAVNVSGSFVNFWDGLIDEAGIYSRALFASEIQSIYNAGSAGKCPPPPPTCVTPPSGLVSWWPGDGNANDIKSSNHGMLQNGVTLVAGKVGEAFSFDGVDDIVRISSVAGIEVQQFTIDAWVYAESPGFQNDVLGGVIVSKDIGDTSIPPFVSWSLVGPGNTNKFHADIGFTDGSLHFLPSASSFSFNTFHHVAATWDGSTLKLYVNGQLEGELNLGPKTVAYSGEALTIGEHNILPAQRAFDGLIDEVGFYNRALSASEIQSLYNAGSAGKCKECTPPEVSITGNESVCPNSTHTYAANINAANPTFEWSVTGGTIDGDNTGSSVSVTAGGTGTMVVSVEVTDGATNCSNSVTQNVTVKDNQKPVITAVTNPITLWPPNHQYVTINVSQCVTAVTDNCATLSTNNVIITKVTSDEPEDAKGGGDGNTLNDMVIAANCQSVQLRSEREGSGNGRVYTIHLSVSDGNGNTGTATCRVTVPKSQNGNPAVNDGPVYTVNGSCNGLSKDSGQDFTQEKLPEGYALEQNYPNPFNPSTSIAFSVKETGLVQLTIYNLHGQEVRTLINGQMNAGFHSVNWDGKDERGQLVPSGVYLYKLRVNGFAQTRKMTFMK